MPWKRCSSNYNVYFLKGSFEIITFPTFMFLFVKYKQQKIFFSQRKIWFSFQKNIFPFDCICFSKSGFQETTFQTFICLFVIRKVDSDQLGTSPTQNSWFRPDEPSSWFWFIGFPERPRRISRVKGVFGNAVQIVFLKFFCLK